MCLDRMLGLTSSVVLIVSGLTSSAVLIVSGLTSSVVLIVPGLTSSVVLIVPGLTRGSHHGRKAAYLRTLSSRGGGV